jgi:hypothetical protein
MNVRTIGFALAVVLLTGFVLLSQPGRWYIGMYFGGRDYNYITGLRDQLQKDPTNRELLDKIIARTKHADQFCRGNAIGVLYQLSYYGSPTGKQIHDAALPVFVRALDEQDQSIKRAGLNGLDALGPYAVSAIPNVERKLSDPDPIIQQEAREVLQKLEKYRSEQR